MVSSEKTLKPAVIWVVIIVVVAVVFWFGWRAVSPKRQSYTQQDVMPKLRPIKEMKSPGPGQPARPVYDVEPEPE